MKLLSNTSQVEAAGVTRLSNEDVLAGYDSVASWFDSVHRKQELTMIVFYRGFFCTGCKVWLQEFSRLADIIRSAGGDIYGVTSESAEVAKQTRKKWNLSFNLISDPTVQLAENFNVYTEDSSKGWSLLGDFGPMFSQPAVLCVNKEGEIIYFWRQIPNFANIMGGTGRPIPVEIVTQVMDAIFPDQLLPMDDSISMREASPTTSPTASRREPDSPASMREDDTYDSISRSSSPAPVMFSRNGRDVSRSSLSGRSMSSDESEMTSTSMGSTRSYGYAELATGLQCLDAVALHRVIDAAIENDETAVTLYKELKVQRKKIKAAEKRLKQKAK